MADITKKVFRGVLAKKEDLTGITLEISKPHPWSPARYHVVAIFRSNMHLPEYCQIHNDKQHGYMLLASSSNHKTANQKLLKYRKWLREHSDEKSARKAG